MKNLYASFIQNAILANQEFEKYIDTKLSKNDYKDINKVGFGGDVTKQIDKIAEDIFVKYLNSFGDILSEESGLITSNTNLFKNSLILLDPLDGSENFIVNLPYYGTSISLRIDGITMCGIVYNLVNHTYIFKTPYETNLKKYGNSTNSLGIFERAYKAPRIVAQLHLENLKFRSPGATALSLANGYNLSFFLLAGRVREFDVDAGLCICQDLYRYQNENFLLVSKDEKIFQKVKEIIKVY